MSKSMLHHLFYCLIGVIISQSALAYPIEIPNFVGDGQLYVESSSIQKNQGLVRLIYFVNFTQPQQYGSRLYSSKGTYVRVNCTNQVIYPYSEVYYSGTDLSGNLLVRLPVDDSYGSYAEPGSWVANVVQTGCNN